MKRIMLLSLFGITFLASFAFSQPLYSRGRHLPRFRTRFQQFPFSERQHRFHQSHSNLGPRRIHSTHDRFPNLFRRSSHVRGLRYPFRVQPQYRVFNPYRRTRFHDRHVSVSSFRPRGSYFPVRQLQPMRRFSRIPNFPIRDQFRFSPFFLNTRFPSAISAVPRRLFSSVPFSTNWNSVSNRFLPEILLQRYPEALQRMGIGRRLQGRSIQPTQSAPHLHALIGWPDGDDDEVAQPSISHDSNTFHISGNADGGNIIISSSESVPSAGNAIWITGHETIDGETKVTPIVSEGNKGTGVASKAAHTIVASPSGKKPNLLDTNIGGVVAGESTGKIKEPKILGDAKSSTSLGTGEVLKTDAVKTMKGKAIVAGSLQVNKIGGKQIIKESPLTKEVLPIGKKSDSLQPTKDLLPVDKHVAGAAISSPHQEKAIILDHVDTKVTGTGIVGDAVIKDAAKGIKDPITTVTDKTAVLASSESKPIKAKLDVAIKDADTVNIAIRTDEKSKVAKSAKVSEKVLTGKVDKKVVNPAAEKGVHGKTSKIAESSSKLEQQAAAAPVLAKKGGLAKVLPVEEAAAKIVTVKKEVKKKVALKKADTLIGHKTPVVKPKSMVH